MTTENEKAYLIYCWKQKGYGFKPVKYNENKDYTSYLNYFRTITQTRN